MTSSKIARPLPDRLVLKNVPRVNFYEGGPRCPEDICLPSVLRAITEYLGDPDYGCIKCRARNPNCQISCSYAFFVGVTGAAFFLSWKDGWHGDNLAPFYLDADAAVMEKHAFKAIGYEFEWLMPDQRDQFVPYIAESLKRRMPVISYGIIGPPESGLSTGYDDGGQVHNDAVGAVAEARWYGSQFLISMTAGGDDIIHRDAIEYLYHAAALYAGEHGLMWELWNLAGGISNPEAWKQFADPTIRRKMVPIIKEARCKDAEATDHIERVLSFVR